ncbi:hypothetical protein M409DRAFT_27859 [Zasmidium cellare ATCC 36951]|uniref:Uncharacterized protein n=1 Tax=Zasmidium cellare ATCC 36951 TaxID=1080233 RepID=A0A6A6C4E7_ZASCE|nr:uncharacterized protein M409DRAFT_27859 [Zasmidium cellare ATCC 36951]KAF2161803.1 hypothetical protein M409DRAFT_27859 [Zasmidium cellare ATCC 36951]
MHLPPPSEPTQKHKSPTTITPLLHSLLQIPAFAPKLTIALLNSGSSTDSNLPALLHEAARLANQLVADLIAFDTSGHREECNVSRSAVMKVGIEARAFVEMYEAWVRDCVDGVGFAKEEVGREKGLMEFWGALVREVEGLVELLV